MDIPQLKEKQSNNNNPLPHPYALSHQDCCEKVSKSIYLSCNWSIMSVNDLSSCLLFICKIATVKQHNSFALFHHSITNAKMTASEQIPEKKRTEGNQVHFKTWCLSQSSEPGLNYDTGFKYFQIKCLCHKYLVRWFQALRWCWYIRTQQSVDFGKRGSIIGQTSKKNNTDPRGWK